MMTNLPPRMMDAAGRETSGGSGDDRAATMHVSYDFGGILVGEPLASRSIALARRKQTTLGIMPRAPASVTYVTISHAESSNGHADRAAEAIDHLSRVDARLRRIIAQIGPYRPTLSRDPFRTLAFAIVNQQISMAAADKIFARVRRLCPRGRLSARHIADCETQVLRAAGLSNQKAGYLRDLAGHFVDGRLTSAKLRKLEDEDAIAALTDVRGIGRWTAEMFLMFCLGRPDVWPVDDLGIQKAAATLIGRADRLKRPELEELAAPWRPYRSFAAWYLWRYREGLAMPGTSLET